MSPFLSLPTEDVIAPQRLQVEVEALVLLRSFDEFRLLSKLALVSSVSISMMEWSITRSQRGLQIWGCGGALRKGRGPGYPPYLHGGLKGFPKPNKAAKLVLLGLGLSFLISSIFTVVVLTTFTTA
jgi:hypothetical protein